MQNTVPYIKENVFIRTKKTLDIMTGAANQFQFPTHLEPADDKLQKLEHPAVWESTNGALLASV